MESLLCYPIPNSKNLFSADDYADDDLPSSKARLRMLSLLSLAGLAGAANAQSSVTLYGTVDLAIRNVKNGPTSSVTSLVSGSNNASQFGFRGREDLGGGLAASFVLESDIAADTGVGGYNTPGYSSFWSRRSYLALANEQYGELRLGRDYAPGHVTLCLADPFVCMGIGNSKAFDTASFAVSTPFSNGATTLARTNNSIIYFLPQNLGGVFGNAVVALAEGGKMVNGNAKALGGRLGYQSGPFNISGSYMNTYDIGDPPAIFKDGAVATTYNFGVVKIAAAYRSYEYRDQKFTLKMLGGTVPTDHGLIKASYVRGDRSGAVRTNDGWQLALGYEHLLSKRTSLYGTAARLDNSSGRAAIPGGASVPGGASTPTVGEGFTSTGLEFGIRHNF